MTFEATGPATGGGPTPGAEGGGGGATPANIYKGIATTTTVVF